MRFVFSSPDGNQTELNVVYLRGGWFEEEVEFLNELLQQQPKPISFESVEKIHNICQLKVSQALATEENKNNPFAQSLAEQALLADPAFAAINSVKNQLQKSLGLKSANEVSTRPVDGDQYVLLSKLFPALRPRGLSEDQLMTVQNFLIRPKG